MSDTDEKEEYNYQAGRRWRWDKDFGCLVEVREGTNYEKPLLRGSGLQVISDIDPYKTVASDIATKGRVIIGGRRQHREFLRRNGYIEVGNDFVPNRREDLTQRDRVLDIKRALGE